MMRVRSLFDVEEIGDRVYGSEGRSLVDVEFRRSVLWVVWGDRCLILRFRRSGFVGGEEAIAV